MSAQPNSGRPPPNPTAAIVIPDLTLAKVIIMPNEQGEVNHFEIPYDKADRAKKFYTEIFGWKLQEMPEMKYTLVSACTVDDKGRPTKPGCINGGMMKRMPEVKAPVVTISCDDIEKTFEKIKALGGKMLIKKQPVGDMGWSAYAKDSEGNVIGLWQSNPNYRMP